MARLTGLLLALCLAACGGGGGGGSAPTPGPGGGGGGPIGGAGPIINTDNAENVIIAGASPVEGALQLTLTAANAVIELLNTGALQADLNCFGGTGFDATVDDRDGDGSVSPGDRITFDVGDCFINPLNDYAEGRLLVDVADLTFGDQDSIILEADVTLVNFVVGEFETISVEGDWRMTVATRQNAIELLEAERGSADLVLTIPIDGRNVVERMTAYSLLRRVGPSRNGDRNYTIDFASSHTSQLVSASFACESRRGLSGVVEIVGEPPEEGDFTCRAGDRSSARIDAIAGREPLVEADPEGDGSYASIPLEGAFSWSTFFEGELYAGRVLRYRPLPAEGGQTPTPDTLDIETNDLVYSEVRGRMYASTDTGIVEVTPDPLEVVRSLDLSGGPGALDISDDGSTIWVALDDNSEIQRVDVEAWTAGAAYALGNSAIFPSDSREVFRLRVAPGNPELVVISTPQAIEIVAYKDGVQLPDTIDDSDTQLGAPRSFVFRDATTIAAMDSASTGYSAFSLSLDPDQGLSLVTEFRDVGNDSPNKIKVGSRYTYASAGRVFDEVNGVVIGDLGDRPFTYDDLAIDVQAGLVFAVVIDAGFTDPAIDVFDESTRAPLAQYPIQGSPSGDRELARNTVLTPDYFIFTRGGTFTRGETIERYSRDDLEPNIVATGCPRTDLSGLLVDGTYIWLDCEFSTAVYDPVQSLIYAGTGTAPENGDSIAIVDPSDLSVDAYIAVGGRPLSIAVSDDGSRLYASLTGTNRVAVVDLDARTLIDTFSTGEGFGGVLEAKAVAAVPGPTAEVLVHQGGELALYSGGTEVGDAAFSNRSYSQVFVNPAGTDVAALRTLYLDLYSISSSGVFETELDAVLLRSGSAAQRESTLYFTSGEAYDIDSGVVADGCTSGLGTLRTLTAPDIDTSGVFYVAVADPSGLNRDEDVRLVRCNGTAVSASSDVTVFKGAAGDPVTALAVPSGRIVVLTETQMIMVDEP